MEEIDFHDFLIFFWCPFYFSRKIVTVKVDAIVRSYNKLKWKNGRDIGEDNMEIVIDSAEPAGLHTKGMQAGLRFPVNLLLGRK